MSEDERFKKYFFSSSSMVERTVKRNTADKFKAGFVTGTESPLSQLFLK